MMNPHEYESLALRGDWLCDVELVPSPDSPGTIDSPWGATSIGYIERGEFRGPVLNGRVLPGGGEARDLAALDPSQYYFRTAPTFRTGDPRYLWLNNILAVGIGRYTASGLGYRIYRIN